MPTPTGEGIKRGIPAGGNGVGGEDDGGNPLLEGYIGPFGRLKGRRGWWAKPAGG
jgi:hypothetical protein